MKKFLDVNDITICFDDTETDKKPIILIPGLSSSKEAMFFIRDALQEDYRVVTLDVRGHGESTHPSSYTLEDHAKDLQEIIKKLELENVDIFGYSMGSYIALRGAELNCENINHLILLCTNPSSKVSSVSRLLGEKGLEYPKISRREMFQAIYDSYLSPSTLRKIASGELDMSRFASSGSVGELNEEEKRAELKSISNFDNSLDYDKVKCRTLVIAAEHDRINPCELGKEVAGGIEGAEFCLIKDAGHMVAYEKTGELLTVIKEFLKA